MRSQGPFDGFDKVACDYGFHYIFPDTYGFGLLLIDGFAESGAKASGKVLNFRTVAVIGIVSPDSSCEITLLEGNPLSVQNRTRWGRRSRLEVFVGPLRGPRILLDPTPGSASLHLGLFMLAPSGDIFCT